MHRAVGLRRTPSIGRVVLVLDLADDLLEDVLQRHQPLQRAVFVDHQGEVGCARLQEGVELVLQVGGLGDEPGLAGDGGDVELVDAASAAAMARSRSLACSTPTMFSGSPR